MTLRQLAKVARIDRDKGMRGDGFEWAVHEAIVGHEPRVTEPIAEALSRASIRLRTGEPPTSLMFGHERAQYLGFLDAVVENAGEEAVLLPDGRGRPFAFGPWVTIAAKGRIAEPLLKSRIRGVWNLFLGLEGSWRYAAATVKSNWHELEDGPGLRIAIVPEAKDLQGGYQHYKTLHVAVLPDPEGFMGLFNDGYQAVGRAVCALGKQVAPIYWTKPSAKAQRIQEQLEKYATAKVPDIADALNEAAQQDLIIVEQKLISVQAPEWLNIREEKTTRVIAPKPSFERLD